MAREWHLSLYIYVYIAFATTTTKWREGMYTGESDRFSPRVVYTATIHYTTGVVVNAQVTQPRWLQKESFRGLVERSVALDTIPLEWRTSLSWRGEWHRSSQKQPPCTTSVSTQLITAERVLIYIVVVVYYYIYVSCSLWLFFTFSLLRIMYLIYLYNSRIFCLLYLLAIFCFYVWELLEIDWIFF